MKEINVTGNSYDFSKFIRYMLISLFITYGINFIVFSNHVINLLPMIVIPLSLEFLNEVLYDNHYYDIYLYDNYFYREVN